MDSIIICPEIGQVHDNRPEVVVTCSSFSHYDHLLGVNFVYLSCTRFSLKFRMHFFVKYNFPVKTEHRCVYFDVS